MRFDGSFLEQNRCVTHVSSLFSGEEARVFLFVEPSITVKDDQACQDYPDDDDDDCRGAVDRFSLFDDLLGFNPAFRQHIGGDHFKGQPDAQGDDDQIVQIS